MREKQAKVVFPIFTDETKFRKNEKLNQSINYDYNDSSRYSGKIKSPEAKPTKLSPKILNSIPNSFFGRQTVKPLGRGFFPSVRPQVNSIQPLDKTSEEIKTQESVEVRKQCENNITQIMATGDFTTLYTHPKLMGHYYWKDEFLHTRKQRVNEIIKVITDGGRGKSVDKT